MNWIEYWQHSPTDDETGLAAMMKFAGWHDEGSVTYVSEKEWLDFFERISATLSIAPEDSIFDVGCGAGASLYPFYLKGHHLSGCDICPSFLEVAKKHMPKISFDLCEAVQFPSSPSFDHVISMGVFTTFTDKDYAARVLTHMMAKARKGVAVLDLNNEAMRQEYYQMLAQEKEVHLFYEKGRSSQEIEWADSAPRGIYEPAWFIEKGEAAGFRVIITPQFLGTRVGRFRFNAFMIRTKSQEESK